MTKKAFVIILILLLLILGGAAWYAYTEYFMPQIPTSENPDDDQGSFFSRFSIFGGSPQTPNTPGTNIPTDNFPISTSTPVVPTERVRQLTTTPTAGAMASSTASTTIVRYVDRGVGHIFELALNRNQTTKLTNTTISRIYEALWNRNGTAVITRYLRSDDGVITNFYADIIPPKKLAPTTGTSTATSTAPIADQVGELVGQYLPSAIETIAVSPRGDQIFILSNEGAGVVGYISKFNGESRTEVFSSPFKNWIVDWNSDSTINLTTKATFVGSGFMYTINTKTGSARKVLGPYRALTTKGSVDGKYILFSENRNTQTFTYIYDTTKKTTQEMTFRTLAEKCVWSKRNPSTVFCAVPTNISGASLPDTWYQGTSSFVDNIWEYDVETGELRQLAKLLEETDKVIDVANPFLDPAEKNLFFFNRRDFTLWSLDVLGSAFSR